MFLIDRIPIKLRGFFNPLRGFFDKRQWVHFWGYVISLIVAHERKNVTRLASFLAAGTWSQRLGDFLNESPWDAPAVLQEAARQMLEMLRRRGVGKCKTDTPLLEVIIDTTHKRKRGSRMEATHWFFDHVAGQKAWGHQFVVCSLRLGGVTIPWALELYLPLEFCLSDRGRNLGATFRTQNELAAAIIRAFPKDLAERFKIRVLFDSAFHNAIVVKACQERDFRYVSVCRSNRSFFPDGYRGKRRVSKYGPGVLKHYGKEVRIPCSRGQQRFRVAERVGMMNGVGRVKVVFSRRLSDGSFLTLVTDDESLSAREVLVAYRARWSIEVMFKALKQHLGLGDYQCGWHEGVVHHLHLCLIAHLLCTYLGLRGPGEARKKSMPALESIGRLQDRVRQCVADDHFNRIRRSREGARWLSRFVARLRPDAA